MQESLVLSKDDWTKILSGAKTNYYKTNEVVIHEGDPLCCIFQVAQGYCRIVTHSDSKHTKLLETLNSGCIFGEISFIEGGKASATVISSSDDTAILVIEGYYLNVLFQYHPRLAPRFYHYLCTVLAKRLAERTPGGVDEN
eukprot:TRINITY_DN703_c0_g3_i1.p1 TRINITY_DN703_c0_g3~~TRINITY_DN703_c0_g3_i1.p1  ORF type:complete len:141 (-),score=11.03 TRINITY_DN703_c0_g3_i1:58-480(-)